MLAESFPPMEATHCLDERDFVVPSHDRYFEDYQCGTIHHYGTVAITAEQIIAFGREFDPQAMHTDPELARHSPAGELIASGIHTAGITVRIMVDHYLSTVATMPSPGLSSMKFVEPVRPGDRLNVRAEVAAARESRSDPARGVVTTEAALLRVDGVPVAEFTFIHLFARRATGS